MPGYFRSDAPAVPGGGAPRSSPRFGADPHAVMLVAEGKGEGTAVSTGSLPIIGAVLVRAYDTPTDPTMVPRRRAHVEALIVDERHRRGGVGTALMAAATSWARERGAKEVVLTVWTGNTVAEAFYQHLGYRVISQALSKPL